MHSVDLINIAQPSYKGNTDLKFPNTQTTSLATIVAYWLYFVLNIFS